MKDEPQLGVMKTPQYKRLAFEVALAVQTLANQAARARRIEKHGIKHIWPAGAVTVEVAKR